ncbi:hypothetical protein C8R44DRAFT_740350 [Mycena epipterygia]|nr:hypothetical protein C8R44DRAFT_740350 [Mycena epipterygia]
MTACKRRLNRSGYSIESAATLPTRAGDRQHLRMPVDGPTLTHTRRGSHKWGKNGVTLIPKRRHDATLLATNSKCNLGRLIPKRGTATANGARHLACASAPNGPSVKPGFECKWGRLEMEAVLQLQPCKRSAAASFFNVLPAKIRAPERESVYSSSITRHKTTVQLDGPIKWRRYHRVAQQIGVPTIGYLFGGLSIAMFPGFQQCNSQGSRRVAVRGGSPVAPLGVVGADSRIGAPMTSRI